MITVDRKKIQRKATIIILDKLTREAKQLAKGVNKNTKHKLNSKKGVITNQLEELKWLDNEIMDLSTDEEQITNIIVASKEFAVEVQETLSIIDEVLTDSSIDELIHIERIFNQTDMSAGTLSRRKTENSDNLTKGLKILRLKYAQNPIIALININSIRNKVELLVPQIASNIDVLNISNISNILNTSNIDFRDKN